MTSRIPDSDAARDVGIAELGERLHRLLMGHALDAFTQAGIGTGELPLTRDMEFHLVDEADNSITDGILLEYLDPELARAWETFVDAHTRLTHHLTRARAQTRPHSSTETPTGSE